MSSAAAARRLAERGDAGHRPHDVAGGRGDPSRSHERGERDQDRLRLGQRDAGVRRGADGEGVGDRGAVHRDEGGQPHEHIGLSVQTGPLECVQLHREHGLEKRGVAFGDAVQGVVAGGLGHGSSCGFDGSGSMADAASLCGWPPLGLTRRGRGEAVTAWVLTE